MKQDLDQAKILEEDQELIRRIEQSEGGALSKLYDRYANTVYSVALAITKSPETASEVVQDVFSKVWKNASVYDRRLGKPSTWIITLARNQSIDRLRSEVRRTEVMEAVGEEADKDEQTFGDPSSDAEVRERAERVRDSLKLLPEEQRICIRLAFLVGLSHPEISERLGGPLGTVKARIRRGLERLRSLLEQADQDAGV